jgi:hypothetical protein
VLAVMVPDVVAILKLAPPKKGRPGTRGGWGASYAKDCPMPLERARELQEPLEAGDTDGLGSRSANL